METASILEESFTVYYKRKILKNYKLITAALFIPTDRIFGAHI